MKRINVKGNSPYEPIVGYSRAVRVGQNVYVAGEDTTQRLPKKGTGSSTRESR